MNPNDEIEIILTGGTIDSFYDPAIDTVAARETSIIPSFMNRIHLDRQVNYTHLCMKDSRQLTQSDRADLVESVGQSQANKILITHGTYTLPDTARYLAAAELASEKVIVLTGAMIPLDGFTLSDGGFNLGFALAQLDILPPGIYVCFNGLVLAPAEVIKLLNEGRFGSIFNS